MKPRYFVLTDISNEPDDEQSLVRLLLYSNEFHIEGLVATTSVWLRDKLRPERIDERVQAYGEVRENLLMHAEGYPTAEYLDSVTKSGSTRFGMEGVGAGQDTDGSELLIEAVDRDDPRPLWVGVWGGPNVLAQALWKVRETRSAAETAAFVAKLRVYAISDQDNSAHWMRNEFPGLFYIVSPSSVDDKDYPKSTWCGISGDNFHGNFSGPDFHLVSKEWLDENVRKKHGPLCALYPWTKFLMEGDTPTYLYLIPNGLSVPEKPEYGGWGGRYAWNGEFYADTVDSVEAQDGTSHTTNQATIWRWRKAYQHDFSARADWTVLSRSEANHNPLVIINGQAGKEPISITVDGASDVKLDASESSDPDGDEMSVRWWIYREAGTYQGDEGSVSQPGDWKTTISVPHGASGRSLHVICEVWDNGTPALGAFRRVIIRVRN